MKKILFSSLLLALPSFVFAAGQIQNISGLLTAFGTLLNQVVPVIFALTFVWFIWNLFHFVMAGDPKQKETAQQMVIWSVIAMFVMVSFWGLVGVIKNQFDLTPVTIPQDTQTRTGIGGSGVQQI